MNKLKLFIICSAFLIMLTGCNGLYHAIDKDTVMVKKITKEHTSGKVEYEGVLSEDAMITISLNAINKYFGNNLTPDDIVSELALMKQQEIKLMLADLTKKYNRLNQKFLVEYKSQLSKVPAGIYFVYIANKYDPSDAYSVAVNPRDGDVVSISSNFVKMNTEKQNKLKWDQTELKKIADEFVKGMNDIRVSDLVLDVNEDVKEWGGAAELFYKSKEDQSIALCVSIDMSSKQVIGFYKDIMAVLRSSI
ncbi:hypothetical protein [Cohnella herbarum]|uniref:Lipoprotein n=1 Tax=Cohnella herbarum TaxID=2728023 RepID=A0A7Z2ZM78_9BACL|nr:hypothetical protein [Cohnella herbarum]QJD83842.1 hypothetical protein HH215_12050 [Cohnella herbarum]